MELLLRLHSLALLQVCLSLQVLQMEAPAFVRAGQELQMQCAFDLEGENLYSVKWFLGEAEIFSYICSLSGAGVATASTATKGVVIANSSILHAEGEARLVLSNVTLATSGFYRCQVSGDGPRFLADSDTKRVTVAVPPPGPPTISGLPASHSPGSFLSLNCSAPPASSPPRLTWRLNGRPVTDADMLRRFPPEPGPASSLVSARLGLQFWVGKHHFRAGRLEVSCRAALPSVYNSSSAVHVVGRYTEPLQSLETRSGARGLRPPGGLLLALWRVLGL